MNAAGNSQGAGLSITSGPQTKFELHGPQGLIELGTLRPRTQIFVRALKLFAEDHGITKAHFDAHDDPSETNTCSFAGGAVKREIRSFWAERGSSEDPEYCHVAVFVLTVEASVYGVSTNRALVEEVGVVGSPLKGLERLTDLEVLHSLSADFDPHLRKVIEERKVKYHAIKTWMGAELDAAHILSADSSSTAGLTAEGLVVLIKEKRKDTFQWYPLFGRSADRCPKEQQVVQPWKYHDLKQFLCLQELIKSTAAIFRLEWELSQARLKQTEKAEAFTALGGTVIT